MSEPTIYLGGRVSVHAGDCLATIKALADNSIDACVSDPPYALVSVIQRFGNSPRSEKTEKMTNPYGRTGRGFMGKRWDNGSTAFSVDFWAEVFRVLKPGAHVLAFGGTRTYHRLACAIEDAGFECRDAVMWHYGTGFPKSHDVSKGIDKRPGVGKHREFGDHLKERRFACGFTNSFDVSLRVTGRRTGACANWEKYQFPEAQWWPALQDLLGLDACWGDVIAEAEREKIGSHAGSKLAVAPGQGDDRTKNIIDLTSSATDAARQWEGWGTALKPAVEPVVLARKPLDCSTVAANVLKWGVGALFINGTRVRPRTMDTALHRAKQILLHVEREYGNNTSCTDLSPDGASLRRILDKQLSVAVVALQCLSHDGESEQIWSLPASLRDHCPAYRHLYDALVHLMREDARSFFRQQRYAHTRSRPAKLADAQEYEQLGSLLCGCMNLLANLDSILSSDRPEDAQFGLADLSQSVEEYLGSFLDCIRRRRPIQWNPNLLDRVAKYLVQPLREISLQDDSLDVDSACERVLFNIVVGPYLITNSLSTLVANLEKSGRWPANVLIDDSQEVRDAFPDSESTRSEVTSKPGAVSVNGAGLPSHTGVYGFNDSGSAARFFASFPQANETRCDLCGLLSYQSFGINQPCNVNNVESTSSIQNIPIVSSALCDVAVLQSPESVDKSNQSSVHASSAENNLWECRPPNEDSAQPSVERLALSKIVQNVQSAADLCDSCATAIAQSLVATQLGRDPALPLCQASISEQSKRILIQCLAHYVAHREGTDIITTIASLKTLFGSVFHAIGSYIRQAKAESAENIERAPRLWYSGKADSDDRLGSKHPTVKPLALMQWLCKLICPPGGTILDCFSGTGTTGEAAWREGFNAVLCEREAEYLADIARRMKLCLAGPDERARESIKARNAGKPDDHGPLFGGTEYAGGADRFTGRSPINSDDRTNGAQMVRTVE